MSEFAIHSILLGSEFSAAFFGLYAELNAVGQII